MNEYLLSSPLIIISSFAILALLVDAIWRNKKVNYIFALCGLVLTGAAAIYTMTIPSSDIAMINPMDCVSKNMIKFGGLSAFFDLIFVASAFLTMLASRSFIIRQYKEYSEYYHLILTTVCGMTFIAHSNHLLMLFIGVEIMSISFYILAGYFRTGIRSIEAALKYFLLGSFSTGFLLYGMAMLFGASGSMYLNEIAKAVVANNFNGLYMTIGIGLIVIGLSFKMAAFPFHQWAPDVYTGSPTLISGFMSTAGKAAAISAFIIIAKSLFPVENMSWQVIKNSNNAILIIACISACTMLLGNLSALAQKNVKRMLAYSSVAHAGYMLMGIVANNNEGYSAIAFYAMSYMFMQIGAFLIVSVFEGENYTNMEISDYTGLRKDHPILAALMAIFMLSLAGIPPFAGFFGKYYLFIAAIKGGYTWLTIVAVISSIISMYFYIGLILTMYFKDSEDKIMKAEMKGAKIPLFIAVCGVVVFGIFPFLATNIINMLI